MITRREWAWAAVAAALVLAWTVVPYVVAAAQAGDAYTFSGFLLAVEDGNSYLAKMGQGARGAWLFTLPYSTEPHTGVLLFAFHLLLGRLAGPSHAALVTAYHAARVVFGVGLLLVSYRFLAEFLPEVGQRRLGLVLVALGGGLGWLLVMLGADNWLGTLPVDFFSPEAYSFLILFDLPHLAAARSLLLLGVLAFVRGRGVGAGLALLGASLIQPLSVVVAWAVLGVAAAIEVWQAARAGPAPLGLVGGQALSAWWSLAATERVRRLAVTVALSWPMVVYSAWLFSANPVMRQWNAQNILPSPHPLHYVLGFGVLLALAVPGAVALHRRAPRLAALAAAWVLVAALLLYAPIPTQRRLIEGVQLPLVALAVVGLTESLARFRRWAVPLTLFACLPTSLLLWIGGLALGLNPAEPVFHPAGQVAVFEWLAEHAQPGQEALAAYETGNVLPAYTPLRAYIGHGPETVFLAGKQPRVAAFYAAETSHAERQALLAEAGIDYVLFGPHERRLGAFDPAAAPYLVWRAGSGDYAVYGVVP